MTRELDHIVYIEEFLTPDQEQEILGRLGQFDLHQLRMRGCVTKRRIASFGLAYATGARHLGDAPPIPDFLSEIRDRASAHAARPAESLQQALVTFYPAGAQIGWHVDHPSFGDTVVAVSLLGRAIFELRRENERGPCIVKRELAPRSLYVLPPIFRYGHVHRVVAREERFSITFRGINQRSTVRAS